MNFEQLGAETQRAWAATRLHVWPELYRLVRLSLDRAGSAATLAGARGGGGEGGAADSRFFALVSEQTEVSITVAEDVWRNSPVRAQAARDDGPFRVITLDVELPLGLTGFLAPAAVRLAAAGVAIVVQCGHRTDHLLVPSERLDLAVRVLEGWIRTCREAANTVG